MKKKTNQLLAAAMTAGTLLTTPMSFAGKPAGKVPRAGKVPTAKQAPRGGDIDYFAVGCALGYKAGQYNRICNDLTEAEKCLALIKLSLIRSEARTDLTQVREGIETEFAETCVEAFREGLLGGEEQE